MNKHERIISCLESICNILQESISYHGFATVSIEMPIMSFKAVNDKLNGCIKELKGKEKKC